MRGRGVACGGNGPEERVIGLLLENQQTFYQIEPSLHLHHRPRQQLHPRVFPRRRVGMFLLQGEEMGKRRAKRGIFVAEGLGGLNGRLHGSLRLPTGGAV